MQPRVFVSAGPALHTWGSAADSACDYHRRADRLLTTLFNWNWHCLSSFLGYLVSIDCMSEKILAF